MRTIIWIEFRDAQDMLIETIDIDDLSTESYPLPDGAVNYRIYLTLGESK